MRIKRSLDLRPLEHSSKQKTTELKKKAEKAVQTPLRQNNEDLFVAPKNINRIFSFLDILQA